MTAIGERFVLGWRDVAGPFAEALEVVPGGPAEDGELQLAVRF